MKRPLYDFAHSTEILGPFVEAYRCGWFDGGCFVFARALQLWLRGDLAVIIREELYPQSTFDHCMLSIAHSSVDSERWYVDANGISQKSDLLAYW